MPRPAHGHPYVCGPYPHRRRFRLVIYTGAPGPRGKRAARREYFETAEAARRWRREFERQVAAAGRTVGDAVTLFLDAKRKRGNKERSIATDRYRLDAILDAQMPLASLNAQRAQDLYDDLVAEGGAVDTHQGCLVQARAFGEFCVRQGWLARNPFKAVEPQGRKSRGKEQLRLDEARTFYLHCLRAWRERKDRSAIAALLPFIMNLRASEVAGLVARDVDDRGRILWVAEGIDEQSGDEDAKSPAARRRLKVPPPLTPILLELVASSPGHLFTLRSGLPANRHRVADWCERHLELAGVRVVTTHGLRGTHSTLATEAGTSPEDLARSMGHEDPGMTQRHYIEGEARTDAGTARLIETLEES